MFGCQKLPFTAESLKDRDVGWNIFLLLHFPLRKNSLFLKWHYFKIICKLGKRVPILSNLFHRVGVYVCGG